MAELADHAFAHACAVLGDSDAAIEAAVIAVRRGGRSRWAVLGHARAGALARAGDGATTPLDGPAPGELGELARLLASTRPAIERVIVDLDTRHELDRGGFSRALGLPVAHAGARAAAVYLEWERSLDPVVLARLGPGECAALAGLLDDRPANEGDKVDGVDGINDLDAVSNTATDGKRNTNDGLVRVATTTRSEEHRSLRALLALGPAVSDHAASCSGCRDRQRSMVSVRTLLAQRPLELAPHAVRAAAAPSRLRRPSLPPPLEPESPTRRWLRPVVSVAVAGALAGAGGIVAATLQRASGDQAATVEALTRVPAEGSVLTVSEAALTGMTPPPVRLRNEADRAIEWSATSDSSWLRVEPSAGTLAPDETVELRLGVTAEAPEGEVRGVVRISGTEGSATIVRLAAVVERPPDVVATVASCVVTATVDDEGEVRAVELHWIDPSTGRPVERVRPMVATKEGAFGAPLPPPPAVDSWWVTATDARGNSAHTPAEQLTTTSC